MRLITAKINITEYLRPKTESTAKIYLTHLNKYFQLIYPELEQEWKRIRRKRDNKLEYYTKLDEYSLQYLKEERDYRKDLLDYQEALSKYAPKTRAVQLSAILRFLEDNGFDIQRKLKKDLYVKDLSPRIE